MAGLLSKKGDPGRGAVQGDGQGAAVDMLTVRLKVSQRLPEGAWAPGTHV